jgi:SAM-dependent methyltransferase
MGGAINLDIMPLPGVDVIRDVQGRLPFGDMVFDRVIAEDVLEHVNDPITVVQELGRVLKVGGVLWIRGPDGRCPEIVWADLTHKRAFAPRSFYGFDPETRDGRLYGHYHGPIKFKVGPVVENNKGLEFTLTRRG